MTEPSNDYDRQPANEAAPARQQHERHRLIPTRTLAAVLPRELVAAVAARQAERARTADRAASPRAGRESR